MTITSHPSRFYFSSSEEAWQFAKNMVAAGQTVLDYGFASHRLVNQFYIELA